MITLNSTLAAAQNSASRHPLVSIKSANTIPNIPFTGNNFTASDSTEFQPFLINPSPGVCVLLYGNVINLSYTNSDNTQFVPPIALPAESGGGSISGISAVMLTNGNIGIMYIRTSGSTKYLNWRIISPVGVQLSSGSIANWTDSTSQTWVVWDSVNARFYLVYAKKVGSNYNIYKRTSSDFTTWSAESTITPSGLTVTNEIDKPSLMQLANGEWWLLFNYGALYSGYASSNLIYSVSSDKGTTWGAAIAITSDASISLAYSHPVAVQKSTTDVLLACTKEQALLQYSWSDDVRFDYVYRYAFLDFNSTTGKLYLHNFSSIAELDIDTWAITRSWNTSTSPALHYLSTQSTMPGTHFGSGYSRWHVTVGGISGNLRHISILDSDNNLIKNYHFSAYAPDSIDANIQFAGVAQVHTDHPGIIKGICIDEINNRLYILFHAYWTTSSVNSEVLWGYVDLEEAGTYYAGTYSQSVLNYTFTGMNVIENAVGPGGPCYMKVDASNDVMIICYKEHDWNWSVINLYQLSSGALINSYTSSTESDMPELSGPAYYENGILWYAFIYYSTYGRQDKHGLCRMDTVTGAVTFYRPSFAQVDDYTINQIVPGKGNTLLVSTNSYGIAIFNKDDFTWRVINQGAVPQLPTNTIGDYTARIYYDVTRDFIYAGVHDTGEHIDLFAIPWEGTVKQSYYFEGALSGGVWSFINKGLLVTGYNDYNPAITLVPNSTELMTFWEHKLNNVFDLMWAIDMLEYDLSPHLTLDTDVAIDRAITNTPNSLAFTCSNGHLFDPHNKTSLLQALLKKGRRLIVQWGENIAGVDYWQDAGVFYVTQVNVKYEKGVYSDIKVEAEDVRTIWNESHIYATDAYNDYPETVLSNILQNYTNLTSGDIDIPNMDNRVVLEHQWVDTTLEEIVVQICNRFGYFAKITVDDKFSVGKISDKNSINHVYSDLTKLITFEPDDKYSDFTNRVTVQGQSRDFIQVTYPEERVGQLSGTVGWWGYDKDFKVYYSADKSKTCIHPRLVVVESTLGIGFELSTLDFFNGFKSGSITESISSIDPNNKFCTVKIDAPDLTPSLVGAIGLTIGSLYIPDEVTAVGVGITVRVGSALTGLGLLSINTILASIGNYQFEIWATPIGSVRKSLQATADDLVQQKDIGHIVGKVLTDVLAYSQGDCQVVADFTLLVVRLQRNRVKIQKIAHLQDEEGDTIQINHPYTGLAMTVFIVSLKRSFKKAEKGDGDGYFVDEIEGWVL